MHNSILETGEVYMQTMVNPGTEVCPTKPYTSSFISLNRSNQIWTG